VIFQCGKPQTPFRCRSKIGGIEVIVVDVVRLSLGGRIVYRYVVELADGSRRSYREDVFWQQFERMEEIDPYLPDPFNEEQQEDDGEDEEDEEDEDREREGYFEEE